MADNKDVLKTMYAGISPLMLEAGFKLKGRNFVREAEPGVYQLITLGLGNTFSMMANHVGVSFAITTEEWLQNFLDWQRPKTLSAGDYEIVDRYWDAERRKNESWQSIEQETPVLLKNINSYVEDSVLPFLEKMKDRKGIILTWKMYNATNSQINLRDTLLIAALLLFTGTDQEKEEGISMLKNLQTADEKAWYFIETAQRLLKENSPKQ